MSARPALEMAWTVERNSTTRDCQENGFFGCGAEDPFCTV
jgi:hypothetical protein